MSDKLPTNKWRVYWLCLILFLLASGGYIYWVTTQALPEVQPQNRLINISSSVPSAPLNWPSYGQSAIGINSTGVLASRGDQKPVPMASSAKIITALLVLQKKPLSLGQQGPSIALTQPDVDIYNKYAAEDGSVSTVVNGETISEYQMLQAMLLPSADNMADSLAIWSFGTLTNYSAQANQYLSANSLASTHVGLDASGFDPSTTSNAADLVRLGELAMQNPVIAQIVGQSHASGLPIVGTVNNVNDLLGVDNIIGIKTGNTTQAGGVFLSASTISLNSGSDNLFTAVMGAPTLWDALHSSKLLITSAQSNFANPASFTSIKPGSVVGEYLVPWNNQHIYAYSTAPVVNASWGGSSVSGLISLSPINFNARANQVVGTINTSNSLLKTQTNTTVIIKQTIPKPSKWWLILHPSYVL